MSFFLIYHFVLCSLPRVICLISTHMSTELLIKQQFRFLTNIKVYDLALLYYCRLELAYKSHRFKRALHCNYKFEFMHVVIWLNICIGNLISAEFWSEHLNLKSKFIRPLHAHYTRVQRTVQGINNLTIQIRKTIDILIQG